mgnify:CR=1 FL=1
MDIFSSLEKKLQIGFDIFEGKRDPIDLISINKQSSSVPAKYIGKECISLTITKFSGLFNKEEIKSELFVNNICSFLISLLVEIFNRGKVNYVNNSIIAKLRLVLILKLSNS